MAVTRSTAADRRRLQFPVLGARAGVGGLPGLPVRRKEAALLAAAAAVALLGLVLVYLAVTKQLAGAQEQIEKGEIVNLNGLHGSQELLPLLDFFADSAERAFVAEEIWKRAHLRPFPNVGELARMRVPASEIERDKRLERFRERLETARRRAGKETDEGLSVPLLTLQQLREVKPRLVVRTPGQFRASFWLWTIPFFAAFAAVHAVWRTRRFGGDELILPILLVLAGIGLAMMVSVRDPLRDLPLFRAFVQGIVGGCALAIAGSLVDWERSPLRRHSFTPLFAAFLFSIALILFGSGPEGSDAKVNLLGFQPVEIIKILIVLFLAGYFFDRWEFLRELPETREALPGLLRRLGIPKLEYLLPPILALGLVLVFFFLQRDLGPALILSFLFLILYCVARGQPWMAATGTALIGAAFAVGYRLGIPRTVSGRLQMWLSPWDNSFRGGDHLAQGLWSLAGGAVTGTGLGLGQPQRVPQVHTDLVLAAIGEELGFLGLLAVVGLYILLIQRGFRAAFRAGGIYSFFLALGLTVLVAVQILLIAGGVVGVLPLSGVVSPFLSSGRTAMLANFLILGILAGISAHPGDAAATRRFHGAAKWAAAGFGLLLAAIVARAAQVQIFQADPILTRGALTLQADGFRRFQYNPRLVDISRSIPRGNIVDRNGVLLATSDPAELVKRRAILERLGSTLRPPERAEPGHRYYPFAGKTFHLLGDLNDRVNWAATNTSFAERDSRIRLQGYDDFAGIVDVEQPNGQTTREIQLNYAELIPVLRHRWQPDHPAVRQILDRDRTVRMSIDIRLQLQAAASLEKYAQLAGFGGAAVVFEPATGDLLVSVSYPWPKRLPSEASPEDEEPPAEQQAKEDTASDLFDRARYGIYPPGSTFKLVTAMAALRKDPELARRTYVCKALPDGRVGNVVRRWTVRDDPVDRIPHGNVRLERGLIVSCNAFFAQLGTYAVGAQALLETAQALGLSAATPATPEQLRKDIIQASYGQGQVVATPFQMARVAATVADLGSMPEGRWILDESNTRRAEPVRILEPNLSRLLARAMRRVVTEGTGARFLAAAVPAIAGKTGTAEVEEKGSHSWFVGFAPYETHGGRRIAFGVIIEHGGYGGRLAAPAAGEIVQAAAAMGIIQP
ncbi:MAG TPA: FtsW/RodA/SpoVE family cell cycle protein [Thermoanaerobaculia bacterium]|jgi:cell division protein FtsW (lipid II flippase)|nr:FtsW/RodA/SpoVE family cell cycle protein [Thermoanaerobaculia bacterium]